MSSTFREPTPAQLDAIEDALEGLELLADDQLDALSDDETVRAALQSYRGVLEQTRDALEMHEPSQSTLDAIFLAARETAPLPEAAQIVQSSASPATTAQGRSWFGKWFVPLMSLAGSTALVLWIVKEDQPESIGASQLAGDQMAVSAAPRAQEAAAAAAAGEGEGQVVQPASTRREADSEADAGEPAQAAFEPVEEVVENSERKGAGEEASLGRLATKPRAPAKKRSAKSTTRKAVSKSKTSNTADSESGYPLADDLADELPASKASVAAEQEVLPQGKSASKSASTAQKDATTALSRGQSLLSASQPEQAKKAFLEAAKSSDAKVRARAFQGLSLCAAALGKADEAAMYQRLAKEEDTRK